MTTSNNQSLPGLGMLFLIQSRKGERTTRRDLAKLSNRSEVTVDRLIKHLESVGLLQVERAHGQVNVYKVQEL